MSPSDTSTTGSTGATGATGATGGAQVGTGQLGQQGQQPQGRYVDRVVIVDNGDELITIGTQAAAARPVTLGVLRWLESIPRRDQCSQPVQGGFIP